MRPFFTFFVLLLISLSTFAANNRLRKIDFTNFEYPWPGWHGWSDHLEWLDASKSGRVKLSAGRWRSASDDPDDETTTLTRFSGLTLEDVQFGDVSGDGNEEAIVVLRYDTGGTQYSHYVYVYAEQKDGPKLMALFHSGDRADSGLYDVYAEAGKLVVALFDPRKSQGDCCSSGFVRTRYRWNHERFERSGPTEFGTPKSVSRLRVSVFGNH